MRSLVDNAAMRLTVFVLAAFIGLAPCFAGSMLLLGTGTGGGGGSYTGPGDINSTGVIAWWGTRGYKSGYTGKAVNVCNVSDVACADMNINSSGNLVVTTVGGSDCSVVTCTIKTYYDQSGALACTGATACDMTVTAIANRAVLNVNCQNGHPCGTFSAATYVTAALTSTQTPPFEYSAVSISTSGSGTQGIIQNSGFPQLLYQSGTTISLFSGGGSSGVAVTTTVIHAIQGLFSATASTSALYIDGTNHGTLNPGTSSISGTLRFGWGPAQSLQGTVFEGGVWAGDQSANNAAMNSNQHTYWAF